MPPPTRNVRLDVIRAFSIALVFATHSPTCPPGESLFLNALTIPLVRGGWVGVDLFFSLSGYLIAGLLFREYKRTGHIVIWRFLMRRAFKILPSLWVLVAVTIAAWLAMGHPVDRNAVLASLFFYGNYRPPIWDHLWSLAVEEHFYLALPMILVLSRPRRSARSQYPWAWLVPSVVVLVLASITARLLIIDAHPHDLWRIQGYTHLRSDALAIGVLTAYVETFRPRVFDTLRASERRLIVALGLTLLLPAFVWDIKNVPHYAALSLSLYPLAGAFLIIGTRDQVWSSNRLASWLGFIGSRSYSLYLWHLPVFALVYTLTRGHGYPWAVNIAMSAGAALVVGLLFAELVEIPALSIRNRTFREAAVAKLSSFKAPEIVVDARRGRP